MTGEGHNSAESGHHGDSAGHDHADSHGHSHGHAHGGAWLDWSGHQTLRTTLIVIGLAAVATVIGLVSLWPSGEGQDAAIQQADDLGLVTDRLAAVIEEVRDGPCSYSTPENPQICRELTIRIGEGPEAGSLTVLPEINLTFDRSAPDVAVGDPIILGYEESTNFYFYADRDRRAPLALLTVLFVLVVLALGRFRGGLAIIGMASTIVVLVGFVAPSVLDGNDPLLVSVVAASTIAFVSLYLTHGFNPTTTVALAGTLSALGLTLALSWVFFYFSNFTGLATEEGLALPFIAGDINLASLLLGGAMLGALGALDDVTVTQVATVAELKRRNPGMSTGELVVSGIRVGREHIASTVNTLLLAYAGASMPILLLFAASRQSLEMVANSELVAVEIVRTLCGSIGLVAAVPVTTALAALVIGRDHEPVAESPFDVAAEPATTPAVTRTDDPAPRAAPETPERASAESVRERGEAEAKATPTEATPPRTAADWSEFAAPDEIEGW